MRYLMPNVTFRSESVWSGEGVRLTARSRKHAVVIDEPTNLGGTDQGMNPVELVLGGLGGCLTVLAAMLAPKYEVELKGFRALVEGDLDPDGFMEKAPVRPGFSAIRVKLEFQTTASTEQIAALTQHIERICPVRDTLCGVPVTVSGYATVS
jgi:uncharacterized OsmC-like protein